jgi:hypothetical protein
VERQIEHERAARIEASNAIEAVFHVGRRGGACMLGERGPIARYRRARSLSGARRAMRDSRLRRTSTRSVRTSWHDLRTAAHAILIAASRRALPTAMPEI